MRFLYRNFWQLGPLGNQISDRAAQFLHLINRKNISVIVSGQMVHNGLAWSHVAIFLHHTPSLETLEEALPRIVHVQALSETLLLQCLQR